MSTRPYGTVITLNPQVAWGLEEIRTLLLPDTRVDLSGVAESAIVRCRQYLDSKVSSDDSPAVYGINTGFGDLCNIRIPAADLTRLQENLIRSHACGAGEEVPAQVVRLMLALKARSLMYGHSGVHLETVQRLLDFYNAGVIPVVYTQGSLGASGDLAPLAHLCLPLIGEGEAWYNGERLSGAEVLNRMGHTPLKLASKEGLALLNGTQFMLAHALYCLAQGMDLLDHANRIGALSTEAFDGRPEPFFAPIHRVRPHAGQSHIAAEFRRLFEGSELMQRPKTHVQDPYAFRCIPQVHGASYDTLQHCASVFLTEANSVSDNPLIFPDEDMILSGGNFHGQPLAIALDLLAIALAEIGSISERRTYQLISGTRGLPAFLVSKPGLNSGLMIPQYTAAGIVSQNKQLCTPASVDSIPSSNGQEDHVSMGANAATKCLRVLENLRTILSIELLNASQALSFRAPAQPGTALRPYLDAFRRQVPLVTEDRYLHADIQAARASLS